MAHMQEVHHYPPAETLRMYSNLIEEDEIIVAELLAAMQKEADGDMQRKLPFNFDKK